MPSAVKPAEIFDRDAEWADLARFATDEGAGAKLGVVSGRRRQGKTLLLYNLAQATGGLYFAADQTTAAESLRQLAEAIRAHTASSAPPRLDGWDDAIVALLELGRDRPVTVVLDEFPYLVQSARSLPSIIQRMLTPGHAARERSRTRLLLCGSALGFMGRLLSGAAPLRGRAGLELVVPALDYRQAAEFWGLADPRLAALVHSIVGGTPAYRREYANNDSPRDLADFDDWVCRTALNPSSPLFREARYLLAEEPSMRDLALYHSVLAAVSEKNHTRGGIAAYVGRKATDLQHPLTVLEDSGLISREPDPFRRGRSTYQVTEPLVVFYNTIMRPTWARLERRQAGPVWAQSQHRFDSAVIGPHFEALCRTWLTMFAAAETLDEVPSLVSHGVVNDPANRTQHELDMVVLSEGANDGHAVLAIGEAKWNERMGARHLARLRHVRDLIAATGNDSARNAKLICASGVGFASELAARANEADILLVDLDRLYFGE